MLVKKILQITIDLISVNDIYNPNKKEMLKSKLELKFKNKCYQSMLIKDILNVLRYSDTKFTDNRLDGSAFIDVTFEVEGLVLVPGEIIYNCKIVDINAFNVIFDMSFASGVLKNNKMPNNEDPENLKKLFKILKPNMKIPVIVISAKYMPNKEKISVIGIPYVPYSYPNISYRITSPLNVYDSEKLAGIVDEYKRELEIHKKLSTKSEYAVFNELLFPLKNDKVNGKFKTLDLNIDKLFEVKTGYIMYPNEYSKNSTISLLYSDNTSEYMTVDNSMVGILNDIISKKILYLQNLRGFIENYDKEKYQENKIYWHMCMTFKK
jgi:DNA-directed RNA polymerase subunit E'/Rpb7